MKNLCLSVFLMLNTMLACAQSEYGIKNIHAFYSVHRPGTIPVDPNGASLYKGPDTLYTIYVETLGKDLNWTLGWKIGKSYSVKTTLIKEIPFEIGIQKNTNKKISMSPVNGSKMYQLQLIPNGKNILPPGKMKKGD